MNGDDDKAQPLSEDNTSMECDPINDPKSEVLAAVDDFGFQETSGGTSLVLAQVESRASIPPLEVDLDDIEETDFDSSQNQEKLLGANKDEKSKRREKQKDKEERLVISLETKMLYIWFQLILKNYTCVERRKYKLLKEDCWSIMHLRMLMNLRNWLEALQTAALSG